MKMEDEKRGKGKEKQTAICHAPSVAKKRKRGGWQGIN
jgi:hypothetical protein